MELGAQGMAGGILMMWDNRTISKLDSDVGAFSVSCVFKNVDDAFEWVMTRVYGTNDDDLRASFWLELEGVKIK